MPGPDRNRLQEDELLDGNTYVRIMRGMSKTSLRDKILDAGLKVMFRKGYTGSGVRDIVAEARAPQGSFTNHFRSKEIFAREVLDRYFEGTQDLVSAALDDKSLSARERLRRYLDIITARLAADGFMRGCLIGDFSLEAIPHSEMLRERLVEIFAQWRAPFAACIVQAQAAGEVAATFTADDLAEFLLASWEGAILRMKVERSVEPLERFKTIAFNTVFKEP
jgi:TetR/AcrR family transcriptional repressor of nem operon